jgi:uncharacterized protein YgbK (DUF1537 family)
MSSSCPQSVTVRPDPCKGASHKGFGATGTASWVLLIADDLTGACDSGLAFAQAGLRVRVQLGALGADRAKAADVLVLSSDTRNAEPEEARARMESFGAMRGFSGNILFHKVDSAGRGNPGTEMLALMEISGSAAVVYAPAYPAAGRTVEHGLLRVRDFRGQDTEKSLLELIPEQARERVALLACDEIEQLRKQMLAAHAAGKTIWLCDATEQKHLEHVAEATEGLLSRLFFSGSAGLAEAVAGRLKSGLKENGFHDVLPKTQGRCLVICGTDHPVTLAQMHALIPRATVLTLEGNETLPTTGCGVVTMDWETATVESFQRFWKRAEASGPMERLVMTGGATAAFVLAALGAEALLLGGALEQGIPWSVVEGGMAAGRVAITKSGGFGTELSLARAAGFLDS